MTQGPANSPSVLLTFLLAEAKQPAKRLKEGRTSGSRSEMSESWRNEADGQCSACRIHVRRERWMLVCCLVSSFYTV